MLDVTDEQPSAAISVAAKKIRLARSVGGLQRCNDPVRLDLIFDICRPHPGGIRVVDDEGTEVPRQIVRAGKGADGLLDYASLYFLANIPRGEPGFVQYYVYLSPESPGSVSAVATKQHG